MKTRQLEEQTMQLEDQTRQLEDQIEEMEVSGLLIMLDRVWNWLCMHAGER